MTRILKCVSALALVMIVGGCSATSIRDSWVAPDLQPPLEFNKMLVVFMDPEERTRRAAENALVARIGSDRAVASHTMFSAAEVRNAEENEEANRRAVQDAGIDAAVVMRMIGEEDRLSYSSGMTYPTFYGGFYGYYRYGWGVAYSPGYMTTNTVVSGETNLYDVDDNLLVWSGVTETFNPDQVQQIVEEVAAAVVQDLRNRRLVR